MNPRLDELWEEQKRAELDLVTAAGAYGLAVDNGSHPDAVIESLREGVVVAARRNREARDAYRVEHDLQRSLKATLS